MTAGSDTPFPPPFPPPGWVTSHELAQRLGVAHESLTASNWKWRGMLKGKNKIVRAPGTGGRVGLYPVEVMDEILAAQRAHQQARQNAVTELPSGFVDKKGACAFFGVTRYVWKSWIRTGKVTCGKRVDCMVGGRRTLYAIADLQRLKEGLFGEEKLYKQSDQVWHIPAGYISREEAWERFGVGVSTWWRWEKEGKITCGLRVPGGPKMYKTEEIERLVAEFGTLRPPYPDPQRPGVYRVPLSGRDIQRREALIDESDLPLIQARSCAWSSTGEGEGFVSLSSPEGGSQPLRRVIMSVTEAGLNVRHANGDPLDCRRENLIVRSIKQRVRNARKRKSVNGKPCSSRFKGVYWHRGMKRWYARISLQRKMRHLGHFSDEIAAALAYDEGARMFFGEDARLNFPDGVDAWLESEGFPQKQVGRAAA